MATPAAEVDADGQAVRVSSPDRLIYPATESTPEITKLQVAEYYAPSATGIMRALGDRPTALERWTTRRARRHQARDRAAATRATRSTASGCPRALRTYVETTRVTFPSGRTADEVCVANLATVAWCAQMGTITFHPWPTRSGDNDHPDELRIDLDPQPGTTFTDAVRVAGVARELLEELGHHRLPEDERQPRRARLRAHRAALGLRRRAARRHRLRPRAGEARRGRHHEVVEGGARRAHLRRLQPELPRPHDRLGVLAAPAARCPGLDPDDLGRAGRP